MLPTDRQSIFEKVSDNGINRLRIGDLQLSLSRQLANDEP